MPPQQVQYAPPAQHYPQEFHAKGMGKGLSEQESTTIHKRATWLTGNVFQDRPINEEAIQAMMSLGCARALELFKEIEAKKDDLRNPSGYLIKAARNEGAAVGHQQMPPQQVQYAPPAQHYPQEFHAKGMGKGLSEQESTTIHKRATWLTSNVFPDRPINEEAIQAMMALGCARALELFKEIEAKNDDLRNPSGYLIKAARNEGAAVGHQQMPPEQVQYAPPAQHYPQEFHAKGMGKGLSEQESTTIHKRATWLTGNVFQDRPINEEAIQAMMSLGCARALELFKEIEAKKDDLRNPSGYLIKAALNEGVAVSHQQMPPQQVQYAPPAQHYPQEFHAKGMGKGLSEQESTTIHKRATWLTGNVFQDRPINEEAIQAMMALGCARALELFKEIEAKKDDLRNPSGYLIKAARNEGAAVGHQQMPPQQVQYAPPAQHYPQEFHAKGMGKGLSEQESTTIHKRATWLTGNVFPDRPINEEAIQAMMSLGCARALELFKEIEAKKDDLRNPSGYLIKAAQNEGVAAGVQMPAHAPVYAPPPFQGRGNGIGSAPAAQFQSMGKGKGSPDHDKIHRKVTWMNKNVFTEAPIDAEAIEVLAGLGSVERVFAMLDDLQTKGAEVKNPSGYLKASAKREWGPWPRVISDA
ncbi:unnamed protein product, partial [Polarella glacialis]